MGKKKKKQPKFKISKLILIVIATIAILAGIFLYWYFTLKSPDLSQPPLKTLASNHNIRLGIHVDSSRLKDRIYPELIANQFNFINIDGGAHFKEIEPSKDIYNFATTDRMVTFAEQHNMPVQLHHLIWGDVYMLPDWLLKGNYSKSEILDILHDHVKQIMTRYKNSVNEYSVINEAFTEKHHIFGLHNWLSQHTGGNLDYIDQVFVWARQTDPSAKLILNDFYNESENEISNDMYNYIKAARARGIPIDGYGIQLHVDGAHPPQKDNIIKNINRFNSIGVPTFITEFDVNMRGVKGSNMYKRQLEANITYDMVRACVEAKGCVSFNLFGITDKNDILKKLALTRSRSYMFDSRYRPKPSYYAFRQAWLEI